MEDKELHPISLTFYNKNKESPIDLYIENNNTRIINEEKTNDIFNITTPSINISDELFLDIYNIDYTNIDTLKLFIKNNRNNKKLILNIMNIWIRINLKNNNINIKEYNNFIVDTYSKFLDITSNKDKQKLNKFITNWLNSIDINDFYFNLYNDVKKFLNK